jgi:bisphosphoglycerate-independent phosphoglycerate mutase (AlkP superfamily)
MGMDYVGETHGADSGAYRKHATRQDIWLATYLVEWMERGYRILVTSDHGINTDGFHGGTTLEVREVPLYLIQPDIAGKGDTQETVSQLQIAPTICKLLEIPVPQTMKAAALL